MSKGKIDEYQDRLSDSSIPFTLLTFMNTLLKLFRLCLIAVFLFLQASNGLFGQTLDLVRNGKSNAFVVVSAEVCPPIDSAVADLQSYWNKITGTSVRKSVQPGCYERIQNPDCVEIIVMTADQAARLIDSAMKQRLESASDQAFYLKSDAPAKRLFIIGKGYMGTRNGVYTFLQKYLGVRWFYPGKLGECYAKAKTLVLDPIDDFQEPSFERRELSCASVFVGAWTFDEVKDWNYRNRLHMGDYKYYSVQGGGHLSFEQAVPQSLFQTHPEYFPLINGQRVQKNEFGPVQRCVSNPDVFKRMVDYLCDFYAYAPKGEFCMGAWDGENLWCQCDACKTMADDNGTYSISKLAYTFYSRVSTEVKKRFPNAGISFHIYSQYREPFKPEWNIKYPAGLHGVYCPHGKCEMHAFNDPNCYRNAKFYAWMKDWQKLVPDMKMTLFDYLVCSNNPYAPLEYVAGNNIKLFKKEGLAGYIDHQSNAKDSGFWNSNWQTTYVNAQLLWDANQTVEGILDDAYSRYYGPAAEVMKAYHAYRKELWDNAPTEHMGYPHSPRRIAECLLVPGSLKKLNGYLEAALQALSDLVKAEAGLPPEKKSDPSMLARQRERVLLDRKFLNELWVESYKKIEAAAKSDRQMPVRALDSDAKITIDGQLDESDWKKVQVVDAFRQLNGADPSEQTRVRVLYDADNWYFGLEALTEKAKSALKTAAAGPDDGKIGQDDSMEIFLAPPKSTYFHWMINSAGLVYDAKGMDKSFQSGIEVKTTVQPDRYTIEARIPVARLAAVGSDAKLNVEPGQIWQFHFWRTVTNLLPPASREGYGLDGVKTHDQPMFRRALIGEPVLRNGEFGIINQEKQFPESWGVSKGGSLVSIEGKPAIELKPAALYQYMYRNPAWAGQGYEVQGKVLASGKGTIRLWLRTNRKQLTKPKEERDGSQYDDSRDVQIWNLTETPTEYPFSFPLQPDEAGYLYVSALDATVYYVLGARK